MEDDCFFCFFFTLFTIGDDILFNESDMTICWYEL